MDSDDDYQSFSPLKEPSPPRRLKRLKKSRPMSSMETFQESIDDPLLFQVDFAKLEALENDSEPQYLNESKSAEDISFSQESPSQGIENEVEIDRKLGSGSNVEVSKAKRVLEFDAELIGGVHEMTKTKGEDSESVEMEKGAKKKSSPGELFDDKKDKEMKKKKKRKSDKSDNGDELNLRPSNKRREEKERKIYLQELHAESQRILRETRGASFRPTPVVQKPISSVLEKIRKRKLEVTKKSLPVKDISHRCEGNIRPRDGVMNLDVSNEERAEAEAIVVEKDMGAHVVDKLSSLDAPNMDKDDNERTTLIQTHELANEEPTPAFRAPVDDTQDLFEDLESNVATVLFNDGKQNSPLKEDFPPSLPSMNLTFDSAPVDDRSRCYFTSTFYFKPNDCDAGNNSTITIIVSRCKMTTIKPSSSSEEEDNSKENVNPHPRVIAGGSSPPKGDPVKDFIDEEAEEEDYGDNDLSRFEETEAVDDIDDFEELNDMIATEYEERASDKEARDELHQKWLELQDAAGTDNLVQRLKCSSVLKDTFLLSDNKSETDMDEELDEETGEEPLQQKPSRVNIKKAKQMILELFLEKEDTYLSDDDGDTLGRHAQCVIRKEQQATLVSPYDDENSREVFGLIKKLNIASEIKRKPKSLSIFDSVIQGENRNHSSKSSFLGRVSSHPLLSSHKQGSTTIRPFIFGRDDSNSRSSMSISEDYSDMVSKETRSTRNISAKYCNTRSKAKSQSRDAAVDTFSRTSLLEILKQSSSHTRVCNQSAALDLTKSIFSFNVPKKIAKIEGRN